MESVWFFAMWSQLGALLAGVAFALALAIRIIVELVRNKLDEGVALGSSPAESSWA